MSEKTLYPNDLKAKDIDSLKPWQLLTAAMHFSPAMDDCVMCNVGYFFSDKTIWLQLSDSQVPLSYDLDIDDPLDSLNIYFVQQTEYNGVEYMTKAVPFDWKVFCAEFLKAKIAERKKANV